MTIEAHTHLAGQQHPSQSDALDTTVAVAAQPVLSPPRARWFALDVFRALAVVWMIQGHTYTALLGNSGFKGGFGQLYRMLHGLTAPMFLCGAGLAYGIVMFNERKPAPAGRILRRALSLLFIGTVLQLPSMSPWVIARRRDYLITATQPRALQLVAACLLVAELLRIVTGRNRPVRFAWVASIFGLSVASLAPWIWTARISSQYVLGGWLDGQTGAQFPFVPWVCFFLLGAALAGFWGTRLWLERWRAPALGVIGFGLSALCYWQYLSGERLSAIYGEHAFWHTSPMFVSFRAGLVLAWLGLLSAASAGLARLFAVLPALGRVISALSRHSLIAYVVHLILLYGSPVSRGLKRLRPHYDFYECSVAFVFVLTSSLVIVMQWHRLRELAIVSARMLRRALQQALALSRRPDAAD